MVDEYLNKIKSMLKNINKNEVPVAAIIVKNNKIIAKACNKREIKQNVLGHAEIICIQKATKKLKNWNLNDCDMYVSLKPCTMCTEIIKQARLKNVYYLLDKPDFKHDFAKTKFILLNNDEFTNSYQQLLKSFFKNKRKN